MADTRITFQEVRDTAAKMRGHNDKLTDYLTQIKSTINALEAEWTSDTSDTIRAKITGMQPKFDSYKEVIESYCKFLDNTAQKWEETENALSSNAASQFV